MSKVVFLSNAAQAYLHAPLKQMVSLEKTKFDPVLSKADGQQVNAQPTMTLSEMQELQQNQLFDVTALVADISDGKPAGSTGRYVRDVKLIDQSGEDKKVQEVAVSFSLYCGSAILSFICIDLSKELDRFPCGHRVL